MSVPEGPRHRNRIADLVRQRRSQMESRLRTLFGQEYSDDILDSAPRPEVAPAHVRRYLRRPLSPPSPQRHEALSGIDVSRSSPLPSSSPSRSSPDGLRLSPSRSVSLTGQDLFESEERWSDLQDLSLQSSFHQESLLADLENRFRASQTVISALAASGPIIESDEEETEASFDQESQERSLSRIHEPEHYDYDIDDLDRTDDFSDVDGEDFETEGEDEGELYEEDLDFPGPLPERDTFDFGNGDDDEEDDDLTDEFMAVSDFGVDLSITDARASLHDSAPPSQYFDFGTIREEEDDVEIRLDEASERLLRHSVDLSRSLEALRQNLIVLPIEEEKMEKISERKMKPVEKDVFLWQQQQQPQPRRPTHRIEDDDDIVTDTESVSPARGKLSQSLQALRTFTDAEAARLQLKLGSFADQLTTISPQQQQQQQQQDHCSDHDDDDNESDSTDSSILFTEDDLRVAAEMLAELEEEEEDDQNKVDSQSEVLLDTIYSPSLSSQSEEVVQAVREASAMELFDGLVLLNQVFDQTVLSSSSSKDKSKIKEEEKEETSLIIDNSNSLMIPPAVEVGGGVRRDDDDEKEERDDDSSSVLFDSPIHYLSVSNSISDQEEEEEEEEDDLTDQPLPPLAIIVEEAVPLVPMMSASFSSAEIAEPEPAMGHVCIHDNDDDIEQQQQPSPLLPVIVQNDDDDDSLPIPIVVIKEDEEEEEDVVAILNDVVSEIIDSSLLLLQQQDKEEISSTDCVDDVDAVGLDDFEMEEDLGEDMGNQEEDMMGELMSSVSLDLDLGFADFDHYSPEKEQQQAEEDSNVILASVTILPEEDDVQEEEEEEEVGGEEEETVDVIPLPLPLNLGVEDSETDSVTDSLLEHFGLDPSELGSTLLEEEQQEDGVLPSIKTNPVNAEEEEEEEEEGEGEGEEEELTRPLDIEPDLDLDDLSPSHSPRRDNDDADVLDSFDGFSGLDLGLEEFENLGEVMTETETETEVEVVVEDSLPPVDTLELDASSFVVVNEEEEEEGVGDDFSLQLLDDPVPEPELEIGMDDNRLHVEEDHLLASAAVNADPDSLSIDLTSDSFRFDVEETKDDPPLPSDDGNQEDESAPTYSFSFADLGFEGMGIVGGSAETVGESDGDDDNGVLGMIAMGEDEEEEGEDEEEEGEIVIARRSRVRSSSPTSMALMALLQDQEDIEDDEEDDPLLPDVCINVQKRQEDGSQVEVRRAAVFDWALFVHRVRNHPDDDLAYNTKALSTLISRCVVEAMSESMTEDDEVLVQTPRSPPSVDAVILTVDAQEEEEVVPETIVLPPVTVETSDGEGQTLPPPELIESDFQTDVIPLADSDAQTGLSFLLYTSTEVQTEEIEEEEEGEMPPPPLRTPPIVPDDEDFQILPTVADHNESPPPPPHEFRIVPIDLTSDTKSLTKSVLRWYALDSDDNPLRPTTEILDENTLRSRPVIRLEVVSSDPMTPVLEALSDHPLLRDDIDFASEVHVFRILQKGEDLFRVNSRGKANLRFFWVDRAKNCLFWAQNQAVRFKATPQVLSRRCVFLSTVEKIRFFEVPNSSIARPMGLRRDTESKPEYCIVLDIVTADRTSGTATGFRESRLEIVATFRQAGAIWFFGLTYLMLRAHEARERWGEVGQQMMALMSRRLSMGSLSSADASPMSIEIE